MSTAFESFVTVHQYQLAPIPKELWEVRYMCIYIKDFFIYFLLVSFHETWRGLS